jgi:hypothetical protein
MLKSRFTLAALCALPALFSTAGAQEAPKVYTYIAEFTVPRAQWGEFMQNWKKDEAPMLERLLASGAITEYGTDAALVHVDGVPTHSIWWCAPTFAGTQSVLDEFAKLPPNPLLASVKHRDRFLVSIVNNTRSGKISGGYFQLSINFIKPGKAQEWRELFDKYNKPMMEQLMADGTLTGYGVDREYVHTETPAARYEWVMAAKADGIDKVDAAFAAAAARRSAEERRAIAAAFRDVYEQGTHRDGLTRVVEWKHK